MNWLDAVLLFIIALSVIHGFRKGLSKQIVGLISIVAAILIGLWTYGLAGAWLARYITSPHVANFAGFGLVFLGVMTAGSLVGYVIHKFLNFTGLSFFDRVLGAVFGVVRGTLISVAIILGIMAFSAEGKPPASIVDSRIAPYAVHAARAFAALAPHEMREGFHRTYAQVKAAWSGGEKNIEKKLRELPRTEKEKNEKRI
ncbi:MAG TPA: CvpA family protein [Bryobacteraceae bacterium]|nr:CvpA family protein [Bryobacteraceae bacterium]